MKPFYTQATSEFDNSITIRYEEMEKLYPHWHYHDEYELVYIHASEGIRYVGDSVNPYKPGDLVLLGSKLPHIWINKTESTKEHNQAGITIMHIQKKFIHNNFFDLPLMANLKKIFENASRGVRFFNFPAIDKQLYNIQVLNLEDKVLAVLNLFSELSKHAEMELLSSSDYQPVSGQQDGDRLSLIHNYLITNFTKQIELEQLANLVHMTPQAFCTYFKSKTKKTVFNYLHDLRVGYSCKLLIETDHNIDEIARQSGFNNTTFFNRKFKQKKDQTPKNYRKRYQLNI